MNHPLHDRPNIVFLFSDTGGGHRSACNAIIEAIDLEFPQQYTTEMVDIFRQYAPPPLDHAPDIYPTLSRMPDVWGLGYRVSNGKRRSKLVNNFFWPYVRRSISRLVSEHPCDLIVSVHQLSNAPFLHMLKQMQSRGRSRIPFVIVVTDMVSTHAFWYDHRADLVIVPTQAARQRALEMGLAPGQVQVVGMPVGERFAQPLGDKAALREKLGWPQDRLMVLMVGGGEGMGPLEATARAVDTAGLPLTQVIIAGRNQKLQQKLANGRWKTPPLVYGFVREMPDFMAAADVLVTKAGPGTISEGFIAGLPIILYSKMPGQEDGNVTYVVEERAGVWAPEPELVVNTLTRWINVPAARLETARNSSNLARPLASREIARLLAAVAREQAK